MLIRTIPLAVLALAGALVAAAAPALADDPTPTHPVPLERPPGPSQVPVPDVRGLSEAAATAALREAGLATGGIERIAKERLENAYGQRYESDMVVQQAPPPSAEDKPSWLKRGGLVWLRIAVHAGRETPLPVTAPPTSRYPTAVTRMPAPTPQGRPRYDAGPIPPRPAPPYALGGSTVAPAPRNPIPAPQLQAEGPTLTRTPPTARVSQPAPCYTLSCERKEDGWHVRAMGGAAFFGGVDSGSTGFYGGLDLGYTMCQCVGIDVFYRYTTSTFDRALPNGVLEDTGDWHTVGVKATFDKTFNDTSRWYWWAGLGVGYYKSRRYQEDDSGLAGYGEFGVGYMLSNAIRARIGVNVHAMNSTTGRRDVSSIESSRVLWIFAPVIGVEIDI